MPNDPHDVWQTEGRWWTNYPPPPGFDGEEHSTYEDEDYYKRSLTPEEQAVIDAVTAEGEAEARALGEAQRQAYFFGIMPAAPADFDPAIAPPARPPEPDAGPAD